MRQVSKQAFVNAIGATGRYNREIARKLMENWAPADFSRRRNSSCPAHPLLALANGLYSNEKKGDGAVGI
ncbi:hypothetical protein [Ciceribacter selenitireducens]|uniref:hypothetical protein n=1 Tax=Ciceribacter selenitireducens TaxID=448181 RepID=UPI0011C0343F|nr:hypothetical protein [Ciceribacter selenitireducens]